MLQSQLKKFIQIRQWEKSDQPFLFATYLKNNWYDKTNTTTLKKETWMSLQHKRLEKVFLEQKIFIACLSDDPDQIVGYGFQDGKRPFIYVKKAWRDPKLKISELLTESLEKNK